MPKPLGLGRFFDFDDANGEIRVFGKRRVTIDLEGLCTHLESLVGERVARTILSNHGRQSGKDKVTGLREILRGNPRPPTFDEVIEELAAGEVLSGYGVVKLRMREDEAVPVELEMRNPIVKASTGTIVTFILSYWTGSLGALLNKTLDVTNVTYDASIDTLKCQFSVIGTPITD
ncbi:MAG TPA: hypothetical protein VK503_08295 [Candidatus Bathyarchaeia archaeon]|nr:hypothetical protein [Candidatus Bathyarchaeia archaeon]